MFEVLECSGDGSDILTKYFLDPNNPPIASGVSGISFHENDSQHTFELMQIMSLQSVNQDDIALTGLTNHVAYAGNIAHPTPEYTDFSYDDLETYAHFFDVSKRQKLDGTSYPHLEGTHLFHTHALGT